MKRSIKKTGFILLTFFYMSVFIPQKIYGLTEDEKNTIEIVNRYSHTVVLVTNITVVEDFFFNSQKVAKGTGSGFIWDQDGHVVTNYHVIEGGDIYMVTCPDQKNYRARLVGKEPVKDIAVLKIQKPPNRPIPVKIGSSRDLKVGQKVIAIGNPFGFDQTVTTGIVSALGRNIEGHEGITIRNMIQTDASINPGNSGGPLLNSDGELIGMNTLIYSQTGSYIGIGFAVPVDTIKKIVPQIIKFGKVIRPGIGVSFLPDEYARRLKIKGAVIINVPENSYAHRKGIRGMSRDRQGRLYLGDILVGINEQEINSYDDLYNTLDNYRIGDIVKLTLKRSEKKREIQFKLVKID
jgi:S1-C subfamily serine protease